MSSCDGPNNYALEPQRVRDFLPCFPSVAFQNLLVTDIPGCPTVLHGEIIGLLAVVEIVRTNSPSVHGIAF